MTPTPDLRAVAQALGLHGLLAQWSEVSDAEWLPWLLRLEEEERRRRSLDRRIRASTIGRFKPMADFDWSWPKKIDREAVEELFNFEFVAEKANVVLAGPNGIGKTMICKNLAHQALLRGHTVLFTTASAMLNSLAAQDGANALQRRFQRYCRPQILICDSCAVPGNV